MMERPGAIGGGTGPADGPSPWPVGDGEMAALVRAHDWAATPLGPVEGWPWGLRATIELVLASPLAMVVLWGRELVQVYNDAYRAVMAAKHPAGLGRPTRECWPEVWSFNAPVYAAVARGEARSFRDQRLTIERRGAPEDAWFDLTYSPLRDGAGAVAGVLVTVVETTGRVEAERALREGEERFRRFAENLADVLWIVDAREEPRLEYLSPAFEAVWGEPRDAVAGDLDRWAALLHPEDRGRAAQGMPRLLAGEVFTQEYRIVRPRDGAVRWIQDTGFPIRDGDGRVRWIGGIARDVTARKEAEERQRRLAGELDHRVKNVLALVQAIASQTVRGSGSLEAFAEAFEGRLGALARAHGLLTSAGWAGADLRALVEETLAPYLDGGGAEPAADGPAVALPPRQAVPVAMVLHELATNAAKHGALSAPGGRVGVAWELTEGEGGTRRVRLVWREAGGPAVGAPGREGFGTALIGQVLRHDLEGTGGVRFEPEGLVCELSFPLG